jgi:hypothetical protein
MHHEIALFQRMHGALRGVPAKGVGAYWRAAMTPFQAVIRLAARTMSALQASIRRANSAEGGTAPHSVPKVLLELRPKPRLGAEPLGTHNGDSRVLWAILVLLTCI